MLENLIVKQAILLSFRWNPTNIMKITLANVRKACWCPIWVRGRLTRFVDSAPEDTEEVIETNVQCFLYPKKVIEDEEDFDWDERAFTWVGSDPSLVVFEKHYMGLKIRQNSSQVGVFQGLFSH